MKNTDFAYAAGYIDGDGCFQIGNQQWGSHLVVVSIRKSSIIWFMEHFDGTIRSIIPKTSNRHPSFHFRFSAKGLNSLEEISKFLVEKKEECSLFQEFRSSCGKKLKTPFIEKMKFLKEEFNIIPYSIKDEVTKIRNTITPTEEDFAYLAGYIDAECSLDISKTIQKGSQNFSYRPQIQCNNTKFPFFYWVSSRFGGQFHFLNKTHIPNCKNQMLWRISNLQLDPILEGIFPFLISKKAICKKMIEMRKLTNSKKNRISPNHPKFSEWYRETSIIRESIYQHVRHLNSII